MIAVCAAKGTMEPQMKVHIHTAMNVACPKQERAELMTHMAVYAGFPVRVKRFDSLSRGVQRNRGQGRETQSSVSRIRQLPGGR
jgi:hypothetical protein